MVHEGYELKYKEAKVNGLVVSFDAEDLERLLDYLQVYIEENKIKVLDYDPNSSASYNKLLSSIRTGNVSLVKRYIEDAGYDPASSKITLDKYMEFKVSDGIRLQILKLADKKVGNPIFWSFVYLSQYVEVMLTTF